VAKTSGEKVTVRSHQRNELAYTIRRAVKADLDRLVALLLALQDHIEASNPDLWQMRPEARDQLKGQLAGRLGAPNSCALVADHDQDGLVGVIFGRVITSNRYNPARAGSLDQAYVRADHRRAGVGSQLVAELCRFFAAEGVDELTLRYVIANEEAASFWAALGLAPRIITAGARRGAVEERLGQRSGL
jgi:GNAT superfamily N-acetyltransferase